MTQRVSLKEIETYYGSKTQALLQRYGPGPRVHYHAGLCDEPKPLTTSIPVLRERLVASQEHILRYAAQVWHAPSTLCGDVLDVGCGLGGGSLFWAQEFGAQVTAVTIVPSHVEWVTRFARQAGVEKQVRPLLCDALEVPGESCYDAAVAVESSCYMPRKVLFRRLAALLRPGGRVFIADYCFEQPEYEEVWRRHWYASIGTISEYLAAGREAGLQVESVEEISHRTEHFWAMTAALIQAEAQEKKLSPMEIKKCEESLRAHTLVRQGLANGGLRYLLMSFSKGRRNIPLAQHDSYTADSHEMSF